MWRGSRTGFETTSLSIFIEKSANPPSLDFLRKGANRVTSDIQLLYSPDLAVLLAQGCLFEHGIELLTS